MKKIIGMFVAAVALSACGTSPEQYLVNFDSTLKATPGPNSKCPDADQNPVKNTSTFKSSVVVSLYPGDDGKYYADFGGKTLSGTKASSVYTLSDSTTTDDQTNSNSEHKTSDTVSVTMTINGSLASGTWTEETHEEFTNQSAVPTVDCVYTTTFRGQSIPHNGTQAPVAQPGEGGNSPPSSGI